MYFYKFTGFNFFVLNAEVKFKKYIFLKDFSIFGYFKKTVSFSKSTFIDSIVNFQETTFYSNNIYLSNMDLNNSNLYFTNTFFPKNADLFDLLGTNSDKESRIFLQ